MSQVILVTGATSGMGASFVEALAAGGHTVYGTYRTDADRQGIEDIGGRPVQCDMTDEASLEAAVSTVIADEGRIDVLINNAGYGLYGSVEETAIGEARHQFEVNLFGLARLTQLIIPHMRTQGSGRIINISSMGWRIYTPFGAWYHATKHALEGFSDVLRNELRPFGIDVVVIQPGAIDTPWNDIMRGHVTEKSADGPYASQVERFVAASEGTKGSPPRVVTDVVVKAVDAKKPRTRYRAGKYARLMVFIRTKLGDRIFDRIVRQMAG